MKPAYTIIILLCAFAGACVQPAQKKAGECEAKIKSTHVTEYKAVDKFGELTKGEVLFDLFYIPEYDENGYITEEIAYDADNELIEKTTFKYDEKGTIIEAYWYNPDGSLKSKYVNECDDAGRVKAQTVYNHDGSVRAKFIVEYDKNGVRTESNGYDFDGRLVEYMRYDGQKNLVENILYDADGNVSDSFTWKYEYDENDNWTKRITCRGEGEIAEEIAERTIEYYE
jgi:hypothetical protein